MDTGRSVAVGRLAALLAASYSLGQGLLHLRSTSHRTGERIGSCTIPRSVVGLVRTGSEGSPLDGTCPLSQQVVVEFP